MTPPPETQPKPGPVALYDAAYGRLTDRLYAEIRAETWGEDLGQASWITADDLDALLPLLNLRPGARLLDVACGSGGLVLRIAERTGAAVVGVDVHEAAIAQARRRPAPPPSSPRSEFLVADASHPLPFPPGSFDAIVCIDAVNHLAARDAVLADWRRLLAPAGRLLYTDPVVITGPIDAAEIAARASIGRFVFTPPGENERLLAAAGFRLIEARDTTDAVAVIAGRWLAARHRRAADLRTVEGDATFDGQQAFLAAAADLARERRLSRLLYLAQAP